MTATTTSQSASRSENHAGPPTAEITMQNNAAVRQAGAMTSFQCFLSRPKGLRSVVGSFELSMVKIGPEIRQAVALIL
jgi:hypothetical protein